MQTPRRRRALDRFTDGRRGIWNARQPLHRPHRRHLRGAETALSARAFTRKDFVMTNQPAEANVSAIRDAARPPVADRAAFQTELDRLRVRENAHTRERDAIDAARRRLPI